MYLFCPPRLVAIYWPVNLLLLLISVTGSVFGQSKPSQHITVRHLGVKDGLVNQNISSIFISANGLLWFGTKAGLYFFDGNQIKRFDQPDSRFQQLPDQRITDLAGLDSANFLFACTNQGVRIIDTDHMQVVEGSQFGLPDSLLNDWTQIERDAAGSFYALGHNALYKIEQTHSRRFDIERWVDLPELRNAIIAAAPADTGSIWILPREFEIYLVKSRQIHRYNLPENKAHLPPYKGLCQMTFTEKGIFGWDIARNIYHFNPRKNNVELSTPEIHLNAIVPGMSDVDNYLKQKTTLSCFYISETGEKIFGTYLGLVIVRSSPVFFHIIEPLRGEEIRGILTDSSGDWWAGTYNGLFSGNLHRDGVQKNSNLKAVWAFLPHGPDTWMLATETPKGIFTWQRRSGLLVDLMRFDDRFINHLERTSLSLCRDFRGVIWAGTYQQLACNTLENPRVFTTFLDPVSGKPFLHDFVRALWAGRDSSIWVGAEDGLYRLVYRPQQHGYVLDTSSPQMPGVSVGGFYTDRTGNFWIATRGRGIARLNKNSGTLTWFTTNEGLCNNWTCRIEGSDGDSILWISTFNGLSRFDTRSGVFHNFYEESGFPGYEFNTAASARFPDGMLMFGGASGLVYFDPDAVQIPNFRYKTIVLFARMYDRSSNANTLTDLVINPDKGIELPPYAEYLEIELGANKFVRQNPVRFRYRLTGLIDEWTYTHGEIAAKYIRLPPGTYTFEAQAIPLDGHFGSVVRIPVLVRTPFYETWWSRSLAILMLIIIAVAIYRYLQWQLRKEQAIRKQIADDLHDDIGNKLNIISILAQKIVTENQKREKPESTIDNSNKLIEVSRNALRSLHLMIWSVDPQKDRLSSLLARMQDFADEYLHPLGIPYQFDLQGPVSDREISLEIRHHILLIFQELLTNMVKHTHPILIRIALKLENDHRLRLELGNKHQVIHTPNYVSESAHRGTSSLERRLGRINGKIILYKFTEDNQMIILHIPLII